MKLALFVSVWVLLWSNALKGQISPGPLSHAHEQFEGVSQCKSCHDFGAGRRSFRCLECHTEIQHRLDAHAGFHARVYKRSAAEADCARCHMEHNGEKFALIKLDRSSFDHTGQTGFALEGKHRLLACEKCHSERNVPQNVRSQIRVKDPNRTFLGLRRECTGCHQDAHRGQEGSDCRNCHQLDAWKPASGFSHAKTSFPLTGQHQAVRCEKCHAATATAEGEPPDPAPRTLLFKGLSHSGCQTCHQDPHRGAFRDAKFQGTCESCHNTSGWKNSHPGAEFDHSRTKFALQGKHAELACSRCHKDSDFHRTLRHERCADCHEDPHKGQFAARAAGSDCSACHNQTSYKPALFDRAAHQRVAFPLEGKHSSLACGECHKPEGKDAVYKLRKLICSDCHSDQHGGQFVETRLQNKCDLCHKQDGFQPSTFSASRHAETRFPLSGKHASVACADCHKPMLSGPVNIVAASMERKATPAPRQYHFATLTCKTCHTDQHGTSLECETCHTSDAWKSVLKFNHSTTKFPLDGAHQEAACTDCHKGTPPRFAPASSQCSGCHRDKDPHGGQFGKEGQEEDCSACHVTMKWTANTFNHDRARFALDVAHRNVACEKCHKEQNGSLGKPVRMYRGTPTECVQCH